MSAPGPPRGRRLRRAGLGLALAFATLAGVTARAEDAREGVSVRPSLGVTGVFDDNVFSSGEDERSDWGVWVEPRLQVGWQRSRLRTEFDLAGELRRYARHAVLDDEFWTLLGSADLELGRGFHLRLSDAYVPRPLQLGRPTDDGLNRVQTNRAQAELGWQRELRRRNTLDLGVRAVHFTTPGFVSEVDLDGDGSLESARVEGDYQELGAHLEWQRALGRRALFYLRGEGRERRFDPLSSLDFRELAGYGGVRLRGTRRLSLDAAVGWGRLDFDEGDAQDRLLLRTQLRWTGPRGWSASLNLGRQFTADVAGQEYVETSAELGVDRELGPRTSLGLELLGSHFRASGPGLDSNRFVALGLHLDRQLTRRLRARLAWRHWRNGGDHELDDFHQNRVTLGLVYAR